MSSINSAEHRVSSDGGHSINKQITLYLIDILTDIYKFLYPFFVTIGGRNAGTGYNANLSHLFFFFIVCLNFKTAKFNSIDVSVAVVCRSSSRISAIITPLFRIRACCSPLSLTLERVLIWRVMGDVVVNSSCKCTTNSTA